MDEILKQYSVNVNEISILPTLVSFWHVSSCLLF